MGLFKRRKSRATRRAEARAIKAKAKLEARLSAKNEARRYRSQQKAQTRALKSQLRAQRESDRAAVKVAEMQLKAAQEGKIFSPRRIRRTLTVARLLAPDRSKAQLHWLTGEKAKVEIAKFMGYDSHQTGRLVWINL